jgi:hypothetical protein
MILGEADSASFAQHSPPIFFPHFVGMLVRESRINADRIRRGSRLLTRFPGHPANLGRHAFRYQSERQIRDPFFYTIQRTFRPVRWPSFCLSPLIAGILIFSTMPLYAQRQQQNVAKLKADARNLVGIIGSDKTKTQTYCQIHDLSEQLIQAASS